MYYWEDEDGNLHPVKDGESKDGSRRLVKDGESKDGNSHPMGDGGSNDNSFRYEGSGRSKDRKEFGCCSAIFVMIIVTFIFSWLGNAIFGYGDIKTVFPIVAVVVVIMYFVFNANW